MGRALASKDPGSVVVAIRKVFLRSLYPEQITTDMGHEFLGKAVASYLQEAGIVHVTKDPAAVNTLAVVDRAIGKYKEYSAQPAHKARRHLERLRPKGGRDL